jgi:cation diffusion facilitator CzcD-associated flavoprotein CzcO
VTPIAERVETAIVGAGQAGLSVGYHLAKRDRSYGERRGASIPRPACSWT